MSLRVRRLETDHEKLTRLVAQLPYMRILDTRGNPPDRYLLQFDLKSLGRQGKSGVRLIDGGHQVEIYLPHAYPRQAPQCRMRTDIFHPNIAPHAICVADHWTAGEHLADLILRIAQMISLQAYNTKSPLDGAAAQWVEENLNRLPIDDRNLLPPVENEGGKIGCCHCSTPILASESIRCQENHFTCSQCARSCPECSAVRCLECALSNCPRCGVLVCPGCTLTCPVCWQEQCARHVLQCATCAMELCNGCASLCRKCGKGFCSVHAAELTDDERPLCRPCRLVGDQATQARQSTSQDPR